MKPGDLAWHNFKEGARMVVVLEVRYWGSIPEWVQVLDRGESLWTAAGRTPPMHWSRHRGILVMNGGRHEGR